MRPKPTSKPGSASKPTTGVRADLRFAPLNILILVVIFVAGLAVHLNLYSFSPKAVMLFVGSAIGLSVLLRMMQVWEQL